MIKIFILISITIKNVSAGIMERGLVEVLSSHYLGQLCLSINKHGAPQVNIGPNTLQARAYLPSVNIPLNIDIQTTYPRPKHTQPILIFHFFYTALASVLVLSILDILFNVTFLVSNIKNIS